MTRFSSIDPSTGDTVWDGPAAGPDDIGRAIAQARAAQADWAAGSLDQRASVLTAFARTLDARRDDLANAISKEVGKPRWEALTEIRSMVGKVAISIEAHQKRCADFSGGGATTRFRPHGVVAVLGPFNFPGHLPNGHIVPALLAGNTVVFKPSEQAPAVAELTVALWREAGLPEGALQLVQGGRETGAALSGHPGIDGVFFTGSATAGLALSRLLAETPQKILALEMGGNNPLVVWDARDRAAAAVLTAQSAYLTAGQRCTCARRLIVADSAEGTAFLNTLGRLIDSLRVGAPSSEPEPFMGPVISAAAARRVLSAQADLLRAGGVALRHCQSLAAGTGLLSPGLIDVTGVAQRSDAEIFGPLLQVVRVSTFEQALVEANATQFGLAAGLLSDDSALYQQFQSTVRCGILNWNHPLTGASSGAPFGGVGLSGNHRPSAYLAADYCSYPVASMETPRLALPAALPTGLSLPSS